jgi:hypothetical protein
MADKPKLAAVPELPRVDEHGEVHQDDCPGCRNKQRQLNQMDGELVSSLKKNVKLETLIEKYKQELKEVREDRRLSSKLRAEIEDCHQHWQQQTGFRDKTLTGVRHDAIQARLNEGYTVEHVKLANVGAAHDPWAVTAKYKDRGPMREIAKFCAQGIYLEDYAQRGARYLNSIGVPTEIPFVATKSELEKAEEEWPRAGLGFVCDHELGIGLAVCPVCTHQMKVILVDDGLHYDCPSGCARSKIVDAVESRKRAVARNQSDDGA